MVNIQRYSDLIRMKNTIDALIDKSRVSGLGSLKEKEAKVVKLFLSYMDYTSIEQRGTIGMQPIIDICLSAAENPTKAVSQLHQYGVFALFCLSSVLDKSDSNLTTCSIFVDSNPGYSSAPRRYTLDDQAHSWFNGPEEHFDYMLTLPCRFVDMSSFTLAEIRKVSMLVEAPPAPFLVSFGFYPSYDDSHTIPFPLPSPLPHSHS